MDSVTRFGEFEWDPGPRELRRRGLRLSLPELNRGGMAEVRRQMARNRLAWLDKQRAASQRVSPRAVAEAHAKLGDADQALHWLEEAWRQRCPPVVAQVRTPVGSPARRSEISGFAAKNANGLNAAAIDA